MKSLDIYAVITKLDGNKKKAQVQVNLPLGRVNKEVEIETTDEAVNGMIDVCKQLNGKDLGFNIHVKYKEVA